MRRMGGEPAQDNIILKAEFEHHRDSWVANPSLTKRRGLLPARALVWGSNTCWIQYRLMALSVYPFSEQAKCHPGVGWVVQLLRCVFEGQIIRGSRDLPSAKMHSTAVIRVRLTAAPRCLLSSSRPTKTLRDPSTPNSTPVSSILYTFSARIAGWQSCGAITWNQSTTLSWI
jgi:hypothetical protein